MESVWFRPKLAIEIMNNQEIFERTPSIVNDIITNHITLTKLVENMGAVLTHKEAENRVKGMQFFTKILIELPDNFIKTAEIEFISKFYTDRLKDHHSVIPAVLEGYIALIDMKNYDITFCADFLVSLFREVTCQSQLRQDRYNYYYLIKKLLDKDVEFCKNLGSDLLYGLISAMDSERDPRNLLFLFNFLPNFLHTITPVGHLVDDMFEVISCYFPIDFHPSPDDPAAVTRDDLANALCPCLCAIPEFGEQCIVLLVEKLDSNLRTAKLDSLKLLTKSCQKFKPESYIPFSNTIWSSIKRDINHKTDDDIKMACHEALSALVAKMTTLDSKKNNDFENLLKNILIVCQTAIAEANTVVSFVQATKILLTTANASRESCVVVTRCMIPATISYYQFNTTPRLQIASLDFLGDMYDLVKHWDVADLVQEQITECPQICLTAVSNLAKEYQIAGFKTLIRMKEILNSELVLPFVEILVHNVQHSLDTDVLSVSVETLHMIARKYPELIMSLVVKGKCNIDEEDIARPALQKRLHLLTNLASIDDFTKVIIEDILKKMSHNDKDVNLVVEALSESMSIESIYTKKKVDQIESDHGLVEPVLTWLYKELPNSSYEILVHGYMLVSNTVASVPPEKQKELLERHTSKALENCKENEIYFLVVHSLYASLHQAVYIDKFEDIMVLSLKIALDSDNELLRTKACVLIAHFLNKVEYGQKFEFLYETFKKNLMGCNREDEQLCPRLIHLYAWLTKALILRGNNAFGFWLQKVIGIMKNTAYSNYSTEAIRIIMTDYPEYLNPKQHCRTSLLYKQRMFLSFSNLMSPHELVPAEIKEDYLLCWAYVLAKTPKSVINNEALKIKPIVTDALDYHNQELLFISLEILDHLITTQPLVTDSLQTILPRLINLTRQVNTMDVRIKSLQCLYDIGNTFRTSLLLPFKQDILLDLAPSLDDKKRLVRNMAVRARTRWFLVGAPGEEKSN